MKVRVAALLATTSFLLSVQDKTVLSSFQDLMQPILNTVVEALKADETLGKLALESLVDLSKTHPQFW
jgi:hypothetical protein